MTVRVTRDWRGVKYKVSECSSEELAHLLAIAQHTHDEVSRFVQQIKRELESRKPQLPENDQAS
jgi:hypothetical protein